MFEQKTVTETKDVWVWEDTEISEGNAFNGKFPVVMFVVGLLFMVAAIIGSFA